VAIIHKASVSPTKAELLERLFGAPVTVLGSYRLDDPDGEVGVEAFIVRAGTGTRQVVLTYRGAPVADADDDLVSTMDHSVLGQRWIYDGTRDPVAVACFRRALLGEQDQAVEELWDNERRIGTREPTVQLSVLPGEPPEGDVVPVIATDLDVSAEGTPGPRLRAEWDGGDAIVAGIA